MASIAPNHKASDPDSFLFARRLKAPIWVYDTDRKRVVFANKAACEVWGATCEDNLRQRDLSIGMSRTVEERLLQYQADFLRRDATFSETWTLYPNGAPVTLDVTYSGFKLPDGRMAMLCEAHRNSDQPTDTLRSTDALLHTDVAVLLLSETNEILYQNPAARKIFEQDDLGLQQLFTTSEECTRLLKDLKRRREARLITQLKTKDGLKWFDLSAKSCLDAVTGKAASLITGFDVTELKETRDKAHYLAARDQLTECFSRYHLQNLMGDLDGTCPDLSHGVLLIDVDKFKSINDTYGHEAGDAVLRAVGERLRDHLSRDDMVVRMGGDEFLIFVSAVPDETSLQDRVAILREALQAPVRVGALHLDITISIGSTLLRAGEPMDWLEIYREVDLALYAAKRSGRGRHCHFGQALEESELERKWLEVEIARTIDAEAFKLHFQPRIDLERGIVTSVEALLRWKHPTKGEIPPAKFVPLCEDMGLIDRLGLFVFNEACRQLVIWQGLGLQMGVSINVSPRQFAQDDFMQACRRAKAEFRVDPSAIELEITESSFLGHDRLFADRINELKHLGYKIAIDDFGTGYSNLAYISRFPVDCIKIDRSFTAQLPSSAPLMRLILALASQIGAKVVAEGVETDAQLHWLRQQNCDQVQGFYFSQAVASEMLPRLIRGIEARCLAGPANMNAAFEKVL